MLDEADCELCSEKGLYIFPNGEKMCRKYYEFIVNEVSVIQKLELLQKLEKDLYE